MANAKLAVVPLQSLQNPSCTNSFLWNPANIIKKFAYKLKDDDLNKQIVPQWQYIRHMDKATKSVLTWNLPSYSLSMTVYNTFNLSAINERESE